MLDLISLMICAILSSQATRFLIIEKKFSSVRASSMTTIAFILPTFFFLPVNKELLHAAILGGSFVGMTEPKRLGKVALFIAAVFFAFFLIYFLPLNRGLGGALGILAFTSSVLTWFIMQLLDKIKSHNNLTNHD